MIKKLLNKFKKPDPQYTQVEMDRGYALRIKRLNGELIQGFITVVLIKTDLRCDVSHERHVCLPIPDSMRYDFDKVLKAVPNHQERGRVWDYILNHKVSND